MKTVLLAHLAIAALWAQQAPEARLLSVFPLTMQRGQTVSAVVRGVNLDGAQSLYFREAGVEARLVKVDPPAKPSQPQEMTVEITLAADAKAEMKHFRVLTRDGLSNEIALRVSDGPVLNEPSDTISLPAVVTGRIAVSGEVDNFWIEVRSGQTVTLQAISGSDTLDPAVGIYEPSGSWFDANRLNRIAFNDEPLNFPGLSRDALLTHTFARAGRYRVRVEGFAGQGGPDGVYELRMSEGPVVGKTELRSTLRTAWEERALTRSLSEDWMTRISSRGVAVEMERPETYRAVPEDSGDVPVMKLPGIVEGSITKPGETQTIRIQVEKAQETVIEVETPDATTPIFTPVVRLLDPGGSEMVANLYTRLNNNNFKMMKAVMAKTTFSLLTPGLYTLQIHELTTDHAAPSFRYRILVRQQIPHIGKFIVQQERISLVRGGTRPVSVRIEREEGFSGTIAVQVENLPSGVTALTGVENPNDRPALPNAGKTERYQPRVQPASLLLTAASDAPLSKGPALVRVVARPIRDGQLGEPVASAEVPVLVVEKK